MEESDDEDTENEDEIWQALVDSRPEVEGGSDEDSDMEMLDLDDSDAEVSVEDSDLGKIYDEDVEVEGSDIAGLDLSVEENGSVAGLDSDEEVDELFANEVEVAQDKPEGKDEDSRKSRRKKLRSLPTFASADDYAEMLNNDEDEDKGS